MALKIAREVMCVFFAPPYSMQVLTCDHSGPSRSEAHDLLLSPLPNASAWTPGLYSLELVCRDVGRELGFNWAETLCNEALPLFSKEPTCQRGLLRGRILIMAQMNRPCSPTKSNVLWALARFRIPSPGDVQILQSLGLQCKRDFTWHPKPRKDGASFMK